MHIYEVYIWLLWVEGVLWWIVHLWIVRVFPSRYGYCRFLVDYSYLVSCTCLIDILEVSYRFKSVLWYVHMCLVWYLRYLVDYVWFVNAPGLSMPYWKYMLIILLAYVYICHVSVVWGYCWFYLRWYVHTGSVYIVGGITVIYTYDVSIFGVY